MGPCISCKSEKLVAVTAVLVRDVGDRTFEASLPALRCTRCGEETYAGDDLGAFDLAVAGELARHDVTAPESFRFMRRVLGLKALELAGLLAVAPETISRWENGKQPIDRASAVLLSAMVLDRMEGSSRTLDRLRALQTSAPLAKLVRLVPRSA